MSIRSASLQLTQLDGTAVNKSACVAFPDSSHNSVKVEDVHNCFEGITLGQAWLLDSGDRAVFIGASGLSSVPFSETSVNRLKGKSGEVDTSAAAPIAAGVIRLVTAHQAINMPCPPLDVRNSPRASCSKTLARCPRTFKVVKELRQVEAALENLSSRLDNTERRYPPIHVYGGVFPAAADEAEVRAPLSTIAPLVNGVAEGLGVQAKLCGGGSGQGISSMDWIVMAVTHNSSSGSLSAQAGGAAAAASSSAGAAGGYNPSSRVLACIEVKGDWQVQLEPGEQLWLAGQQRIDRLLPSLQQLYGDMVQEEVQWGLLTTHNASLLVKRHDRVKDKTLFVSPVYSHERLLLVLLHLTQQAAVAAAVKQNLQRHKVKGTPPVGYSYVVTLSVPQQPSASGRQQRAKQQKLEVRLTRAGKRQRQLENDLEAAAATHDSVDETTNDQRPARIPRSSDSSNNSSGSSSSHGGRLQSLFPHLLQLHLASGQLTPAVKAAPSSECLQVEMVPLDFDQVRLVEPLADGSHGKVVRGALQGREVVVKLFDRHHRGWQEAFDNELSSYTLASGLQDDVLCNIMHFGMFGHSGALFIAFSPAGRAVDSTTAANATVQNGMRTALRKLHDKGIIHGDVRLSNFCLTEDGHVRVIDFDRAYHCGLTADARAAKLEEQQQLEGLLISARSTAAAAAAAPAAATM